MNLKPTLFKAILGLALTCLIICLALGAAYYRLWLHTFGHYESFGLDVSKDAELTAIFHAHQAVFDKLQHMTADDTQQGQYSSSAAFEGGKLSKSRQQEYQNLVSSIRAF